MFFGKIEAIFSPDIALFYQGDILDPPILSRLTYVITYTYGTYPTREPTRHAGHLSVRKQPQDM